MTNSREDITKSLTEQVPRPECQAETCLIPRGCQERFLPLDDECGKALRDRGIEFSGISDVSSPYEIKRSKPGFHLLVFTVGGRGRFQSPNLEGTLEPGDTFIAPAGLSHHYWASERWSFFFFHLRASHPNGAIPYLTHRVIRPARMDQLESAMRWYCSEAGTKHGSSDSNAGAYATLIVNCLDRELLAGTRKIADGTDIRRRLDALRESISSNLGRHWGVEEMAARVHLSPAQFRRTVSKHLGVSPVELLQQLRMTRTRMLLRRTNYTLDQIAGLVGYESPFSLSRTFKKHEGCSPRDYRKEPEPTL